MSLEDLLQQKQIQKQEELQKVELETEQQHHATMFSEIEKLEKVKAEYKQRLEKLQEYKKAYEDFSDVEKEVRAVYEGKKETWDELFNISSFEEFITNEEVMQQGQAQEYHNKKSAYEETKADQVLFFERCKTDRFEGGEDYEALESWLEEQMTSAENESMTLKREHPELRKEFIEKEASILEKSLPKMTMSALEKVEFGKGEHDPSITQKGEKVTFMRWWEPELVPKKEFETLTHTYDEATAREILASAHKQKIHGAIEQYDKSHENYTGFEAVLGENNLETLKDTREKYKAFEAKIEEARSILQRKSEELKEKDISFNPTSPREYGGTYEEIVFTFSGSSAGNPLKAIFTNIELQYGDPFPPQYAHKDVKALIEQRTADIEEFIVVIDNIHTQEDIAVFNESKRYISMNNRERQKGTVEYFHQKTLTARIDEKKQDPFRPYNEIRKNITNFYDAQRLLKNQKELYSEKEQKFLNAIEKAMEAQKLLPEIKKEMREIVGYDISPLDWKSRIKTIEESAQRAQGELYLLTTFEQSLKASSYRLSGNFLYDTTLEEDVKTKQQERKTLEDQRERIDQEKSGYPKKLTFTEKLFGVDPNEGLKEVKERYDTIVKKIKEKEDEINSLSRSAATPILPNSSFRDGFRELSAPKGNADEALAPIRAYLQEKADVKISSELVQKIERYNLLLKDLQ